MSGLTVPLCRRTVLHVYRDLSLEALRPMLEAWAEGLRIDLSQALQDLGSAVGPAPASSGPLPPLPSLGFSPVSQPAGADATSLLRPYLQKFFTEAFISVAAIYHKGQVTVVGNGNWTKCMYTPQQLHHRLYVEGHLPEAIFSRLVAYSWEQAWEHACTPQHWGDVGGSRV